MYPNGPGALDRPLVAAEQDERLVRDFHAGRSSAFDEIYALHHRRVEKVCRRYLSDPRDVEEAVQDTFVKAARALAGFNGNFRLGAWLARIATNAAIDHSRRLSARREHVAVLPEDRPDASVDIEGAVVGDEAPSHEALEQLRSDHAVALRLRSLHGASHAEIGELLGKSPQQVKALLHRARTAFRRRWGEVASIIAFVLVAGGTSIVVRLTRGPLQGVMTTASGAVARVGEVGATPAASVIADHLLR